MAQVSPYISLIRGADRGAAHCCHEHEGPTLFISLSRSCGRPRSLLIGFVGRIFVIDEVDDVELLVERVAALDLGEAVLEGAGAARHSGPAGIVRGSTARSIFSIPSLTRCSASAQTAPLRAATSHTFAGSPARPAAHPHAHLARVLADIDARTPAPTQAHARRRSLLRFLLRLACPPITSALLRTGWAALRARFRGTEIRYRVLEATVRDPSRSAPGAGLIHRLRAPRKRRRQLGPPHAPLFSRLRGVTEGNGGLIRRPTTARRDPLPPGAFSLPFAVRFPGQRLSAIMSRSPLPAVQVIVRLHR